MTCAPPLTTATILPHAGWARLLEELHDYGPEHVTCGLTIRPDTVFCDGVNGVPAWVGLEYMAQTICAYSGVGEVRAGLKPSIGLLLGSRRYQSQVEWFALGTTLTVRADLLLHDENDLVAFACTIQDGERQLACGDIKAYRPRDVHAFIGEDRS